MGHPLLKRCALAALLFAWCVLARAGDIYVVANDPLLTAADIREIYLGEKEFSGGVRLTPVDNLLVQDAFLARVLSMNEQRYNSLWVRKSFRDGLNPPSVKASDAEVVFFVRQTRGAVGYLSSPPKDKDIRVIGKY
jgi:hypothetical protein